MRRKLFLVALLFSQIVLFTSTTSNSTAKMDWPDPPCLPCAR